MTARTRILLSAALMLALTGLIVGFSGSCQPGAGGAGRTAHTGTEPGTADRAQPQFQPRAELGEDEIVARAAGVQFITGFAQGFAAAAADAAAREATRIVDEHGDPGAGMFAGRWSGTLTYLEYHDNASLVALPVDVEFTPNADGTVTGAYVYTEPDGSTVEDSSVIGFENDGDTLRLGDTTYPITAVVVLDPDTPEGSVTVIGTRPGEDAGREASVRVTINRVGGTLTVEKHITPADGSKPYVRHTYDLVKSE